MELEELGICKWTRNASRLVICDHLRTGDSEGIAGASQIYICSLNLYRTTLNTYGAQVEDKIGAFGNAVPA